MKVAVIGHVDYGTTSLFSPPRVSVDLVDNSDRNVTVTGDLLKASKYDLTPQLPLTRQQRRKLERNKNKNKNKGYGKYYFTTTN